MNTGGIDFVSDVSPQHDYLLENFKISSQLTHGAQISPTEPKTASHNPWQHKEEVSSRFLFCPCVKAPPSG